MKRKIYGELIAWKARSHGETALLIQGARRVGKSYIVEEFAKAEYETYVLIDFNIASDDVKDLFYHDIDDLDTFFLKMSTLTNKKLIPRKTPFIFDEVQLFPRARKIGMMPMFLPESIFTVVLQMVVSIILKPVL